MIDRPGAGKLTWIWHKIRSNLEAGEAKPTRSILKCRVFWNFRTDYDCVEKTLLPLIIKHWNSIWVTEYVLIKVACPFSCTCPIWL